MASYKPIGLGRTPRHHPDDALLMDYASGATDEAESLIIATHATLCVECRHKLATMEAVGGALLDEIAPVDLDHGGLESLMARLDDADEPVSAGPARGTLADVMCGCCGDDDVLLPAPLRQALAQPLDTVEWRAIMRGLEEWPLPSTSDAKVRLMRIRAGATVPKHTHRGTEMTLVLAGGFSDEAGHFERGDLAVLGAEADHRPVADPGEDCLCLVVTTAPLRLTGRVSRLLNPFIRF